MSSIVTVRQYEPGDAPMEAILRLRRDAWGDASFARSDSLEDAHEGVASHFVAYVGQEMAASARLSEHETVETVPDRAVYPASLSALPGKVLSYNRLVVSPQMRGKGLSRLLDREVLRACEARRTDAICWTRFTLRAAALAKLGWNELGFCSVEPIEGEARPVAYWRPAGRLRS